MFAVEQGFGIALNWRNGLVRFRRTVPDESALAGSPVEPVRLREVASAEPAVELELLVAIEFQEPVALPVVAVQASAS